MTSRAARRGAIAFVVSVGLGSLLADFVYEGARSVLGPFLVTLGASAVTVGVIAGIGEFVGYGLRIGAGYLADRTRRYWLLTIGGYALNVLAVPLLGLATSVPVALALVLAERLGKAIRVPARDTLISYAGAPIGRGMAFGLHEALAQTGAVLGPLFLAGLLALRPGDYRTALLLLAVPAVLTIVALFAARRRFPEQEIVAAMDASAAGASVPAPADVDAGESRGERQSAVPPPFRRYAAFTVLAMLGFAPFPLIALHLVVNGVLRPHEVPLLFAFAMAVDAVVALATGRAYDRRGLVVLISVPLATVATLGLFTTLPLVVWAAAAVWGAVMGIQESTLRAAVADFVPAERRATGYGIYNAFYGIALLAGGATLGFLYERSIVALALFVLVAELGALFALVLLLRPRRKSVETGPSV